MVVKIVTHMFGQKNWLRHVKKFFDMKRKLQWINFQLQKRGE